MKTLSNNARSRFLVGILLAVLIAVAGCGGGDKAESGKPGGDAVDAQATQGEPTNHNVGRATLAGVSFIPPSSWTDLGGSGMRQAQYRIVPVGEDKAPGEVNVFYFGPESGGGVEANLERWIGQMVLPDVADPDNAIERSTFTADGMPGHIVSVNGTYKSGGGRPMGGDGEALPGYRLVGVVIEGPQGSLFFKLTGPEATARAMEKDLLPMVRTARK